MASKEASNIGNITVTPSQVKSIAMDVLPTGTPMGIQGPPGIAKTATGMQLAAAFEKRTGKKWHTIMINLSQHEPTDIGGIPYVVNGRMKMAISDLWPDEGQENNIIVVEEVTKGPKLVQNAIGEAIHEGSIGRYRFPKNTYWYLSWNRRADGAGDEKVLSHFANRMMILNMGVSPDEVCQHFIQIGLHPTLIAFLNQFKHLVFDEKTFKAESSKYNPDKPSFPSPRSWSKVSPVLAANMTTMNEIAAVTGLVGEGACRELIAFKELMNDMPAVEMCIRSPKTTPLPKEMSVMYALAVSLAYATKTDTIKPIIEYIKRMRKEYQVLWAKSVADRDHKFVSSSKEIQEWVSSISDILT